MSYLVFGGATGWIGQQIVEILKKQGKEVHVAKSRIEDRNHIEKEIDEVKPKYIF